VHRLHVEHDSGTALVRAEGELDAFAAPEIERAFADLAGAKGIVVDLAAVSFLDSTALGLVVRGVREAEKRGVAAQVVLPAGTARRIFEITTLDRVLPVASSVAAATAALRR
jgi:anti-sigma B factor antagonist